MVLVITNPLLAQLNKCTFEKEVYISGTDTLLYQIFKPINTTKKVPLVLFLHGSGERGNDNEKQLIHSIDKFTTKQFQTNNPCYIIAPQCPDNKQWVDVDWGLDAHTMPVEPTIQMKLTIELVKQLSKQLNIDTNRIYITGLSMGGFGVWDAISRNPEIFAAA